MHPNIAILTILIILVACSSGSNLPSLPPKNPKVILEENGWHSSLILPYRDLNGTEVPFGEKPKYQLNFPRFTLGTVKGSQDFLLLATYWYYDTNNDYSVTEDDETYTHWLYRISGESKDIKSIQLPLPANSFTPSVVQFLGDDSVYWYYAEHGEGDYKTHFYKDSNLVSSYSVPYGIKTSYVDFDDSKNFLVDGQIYFNWQSQAWKNVRVNQASYSIQSIDKSDPNLLFGFRSVGDKMNGQGVAFQELNLTTDRFAESAPFFVGVPTRPANYFDDYVQYVNKEDRTYIFFMDGRAKTATIVLFEKPTKSFNVLVQQVDLLQSFGATQRAGYFVVTDDNQFFYFSPDPDPYSDELTKIYKLDEAGQLLDVSPKQVNANTSSLGIFTQGNSLYAIYGTCLRYQHKPGIEGCQNIIELAYYQ